MDVLSGSTLKSLMRLCETHGVRDAALEYSGGFYYLWATTGYLADGSPVVTLITHGTDVHEVTQRVQSLLWAWGRK